MTTGEVVEAMDVGQSTVSHHLQILGETCFVHVERVGTQCWWRINEQCLASLPLRIRADHRSAPAGRPVGRPRLPATATGCTHRRHRHLPTDPLPDSGV